MPLRALRAIGELVRTTGGSPFGPGRKSLTAMAQEAVGLGGPPFTSTRHIRQLPAIDSRSWKQKRGISAPSRLARLKKRVFGGNVDFLAVDDDLAHALFAPRQVSTQSMVDARPDSRTRSASTEG